MVVEVHAGDLRDGSDNFCADGMTNSLAAFLIGAGSFHYYHCSGGGVTTWSSNPHWPDAPDQWLDWRDEYDKALGKPLSDGEKRSNGIWFREFESGTKVTFDSTLGAGRIEWADGTIQQGESNGPSKGGCAWPSTPHHAATL